MEHELWRDEAKSAALRRHEKILSANFQDKAETRLSPTWACLAHEETILGHPDESNAVVVEQDASSRESMWMPMSPEPASTG